MYSTIFRIVHSKGTRLWCLWSTPELRSLALLLMWLCCFDSAWTSCHQSAAVSGCCPCRCPQYFTEKCALFFLLSVWQSVVQSDGTVCFIIWVCWKLRRGNQIVRKFISSIIHILIRKTQSTLDWHVFRRFSLNLCILNYWHQKCRSCVQQADRLTSMSERLQYSCSSCVTMETYKDLLYDITTWLLV